MNTIEATAPKTIKERRLLPGEGSGEVLFVTALPKKLGIGGVPVEAYQGKSGLDLYLRTLTNRPNFALL